MNRSRTLLVLYTVVDFLHLNGCRFDHGTLVLKLGLIAFFTMEKRPDACASSLDRLHDSKYNRLTPQKCPALNLDMPSKYELETKKEPPF
jgi:hypothetical protein